MNRVEILSNLLSQDSVIFMKFTRKYEDGYTFLLLEGDDDIDYYQQHFKSTFSFPWKRFVCNKKQHAISLFKEIKNHKDKLYRDTKAFVFVDMDYDEEELNNEFIYMTPVYSIENFYLSKDSIEGILKFKFNLDDDNYSLKKCLSNFDDRLSEFIEIIKPLDLILRANNYSYKEANCGETINLRDINLDKYISITFDEVALKKDILSGLNLNDTIIDREFINRSSELYENNDIVFLKKKIRGKFLFFFLSKYLELLILDNKKTKESYFFDEIKKTKSINREKFKITKFKIENSKPDTLSQLSEFADKPECLCLFLEKIKNCHS